MIGAFRYRPVKDVPYDEQFPDEEKAFEDPDFGDFEVEGKKRTMEKDDSIEEGRQFHTVLDAREADDGSEEICLTTVWPMMFPVRRKTEALKVIQEVVIRIRRAGMKVDRIHSDGCKNILSNLSQD